MRAETAILGACAGLGVHDGTKMNLVALEMFADAIGPSHEIKDVGGAFEGEEPVGFRAVKVAAVENAPPQCGQAVMGAAVK